MTFGINAAILAAIGGAFGVGALVILAATLHPHTRAATPALWSLYLSEVFIVGAPLLPALMGTPVFAVVLVAFAWRGQFELLRLFDLPFWGTPQCVAFAAGAVMVLLSQARLDLVLLAVVPSVLILVWTMMWRESGTGQLRAARIAAASLAFPALLAALTVALQAAANGFAWFLFAFATVEVNDAFALLGGKLVGRRRILPHLSPKKTAEGLLIGLICGFGAGLFLAQVLLGLSFAQGIPLVVTILAAGLFGDLFTSALKRSRGKKDFPSVHPAHGGVLDIYDAVLFAAPAAFGWLYLVL